jgi:hypothetical protein
MLVTNPRYVPDAYNQLIPDYSDKTGTLIGNWFEESIQRKVNGVARSINPKRTDLSKSKSSFVNTSERVNGGETVPVGERFKTTNMGFTALSDIVVERLHPREKYERQLDMEQAFTELEAEAMDESSHEREPLITESKSGYKLHVNPDICTKFRKSKITFEPNRPPIPSHTPPRLSHYSIPHEWYGRNVYFSHPIETIPHGGPWKGEAPRRKNGLSVPVSNDPATNIDSMRRLIRERVSGREGKIKIDDLLNLFENDQIKKFIKIFIEIEFPMNTGEIDLNALYHYTTSQYSISSPRRDHTQPRVLPVESLFAACRQSRATFTVQETFSVFT